MSGETTLTIIGNLTDEPDLRFTPSGVALCKFTVASTPRMLDRQSGQWKDGDTLFMACTAWKEMAEQVAESLARGTRVLVVGRLRLSKWETPEGEKRSMYQLEVEEVGPSLRWATATVKRLTRTKAGDGFLPDHVPDDAWDSASSARPDLVTV